MYPQSTRYTLAHPFMKIAVMLILAAVSSNSHAIIIVGGSYLTQSDASLIDAQLGAGPHNYNNIFTGTTGASASSWHAAVDNAGPTVSIYDIVLTGSLLGGGTRQYHQYIGGYTPNSWSGVNEYNDDAKQSSFIFNLTAQVFRNEATSIFVRPPIIVNGVIIPQPPVPVLATFSNPNLFATFGAGHDIYGGSITIGAEQGSAWQAMTYGYPFDYNSATNIADFSHGPVSFDVIGLQTYTLSIPANGNPGTTTNVPEPASIALLVSGLLGFGFLHRKQIQA